MIVIEKGILEKVEALQTAKGTQYLKLVLNLGKYPNSKYDNKIDVEVFNEHLMNQVKNFNLFSVVVVTGRLNVSAYISQSTNNPTYKLRINASSVELINPMDKPQTPNPYSTVTDEELAAEFM